jgi:hypothetical protein
MLGQNVHDETEILVTCLPRKVCEHCDALGFKAEKKEIFITTVYFPHCSPINPSNKEKEIKRKKKEGRRLSRETAERSE